jgi:AmmeMemoRadiSam system protein A
MLSDDERRSLLSIARASVVARVDGRHAPSVEKVDLPGASGVFVTVKYRGGLRGCLGTLQCQDLASDIARCAEDAASRDPRFSPVTPAELPDLTLDISVLGPLELIDPRLPDAITIGDHGLVVEQGRSRGLLLPQVAVEQRWTREQFLRQTCIKANLPPDAWEQGARVYRFDAEVFGD